MKIDPFRTGYVGDRRVGRHDRVASASRCEEHAIGERDAAAHPVVVTSAEERGIPGHMLVERNDRDAIADEKAESFASVLGRPLRAAHKVVRHLEEVRRADGGTALPDDLLDLVRNCLVERECE